MTDGVRRLNHEEAEMLISARMDEQLDRADSRALLVHLQTCESCRAFAVQSEVLGRELGALPVLPPSALVDRQIREAIGKGRSRWSLSALMPTGGSSSGLRVAAGALAMLTLVSVFLLIRMAGDQPGDVPSIEAPNGGVAQQIDRTPTDESVVLGQTGDPTETARVVVPRTPASGATEAGAPTEVPDNPTEAAANPTNETGDLPEETSVAQVEPTRTLDSSFVYTIDTTRTPAGGNANPTETPESGQPDVTEESGNVAFAAVGIDDGTPVDGVASTPEGGDQSLTPTDVVATPAGSEAAEPTETPDATGEEAPSDATMTPEPPVEASATQEPATEQPPTSVPEPTATATPVEISVDATEPPAEPTATPAGDESTAALQVESPESSMSPSVQEESSAVTPPTQTPQPAIPTETPAAPFSQPTIAPISGQTGGDQGTGESVSSDGDTSPQIVLSGGVEDEGGAEESQGVGAAGSGDQSGEQSAGGQSIDTSEASGDSPPIVPADGTSIPEGVGGDISQAPQGGDNQEPSSVPTVDDSLAPTGLDLSDTVTSLPSGSTSPAGRLEFSPGMNLYVVNAPDGQLAVATLDGELVVTLGNADLPVWSGNALMFSTPGDSGTQIGIWNSDTGEVSSIPPSDDGASEDLPIGGNGSAFYYLRTYPDSGIVELRSATIDGSDTGVLWTSDGIRLGGVRPLYSESGIYLPTDSEWLFIDWNGNESSLGANPYGFVGAPVLSPGGGLMAYSAGDQVFVAWTQSPGIAIATAPFSPQGGYAFATTGEEIVVSDGSSLHVISYQDVDLGSLGGNQPIGAVYWISDTIYYVQIGEDAALKSTSLGAIESA